MHIVDDINQYIRDCHLNTNSQNEPILILNKNLFSRLNQKVVERKIESIANSISYLMDEEMLKLVIFELKF